MGTGNSWDSSESLIHFNLHSSLEIICFIKTKVLQKRIRRINNYIIIKE